MPPHIIAMHSTQMLFSPAFAFSLINILITSGSGYGFLILFSSCSAKQTSHIMAAFSPHFVTSPPSKHWITTPSSSSSSSSSRFHGFSSHRTELLLSCHTTEPSSPALGFHPSKRRPKSSGGFFTLKAECQKKKSCGDHEVSYQAPPVTSDHQKNSSEEEGFSFKHDEVNIKASSIDRPLHRKSPFKKTEDLDLNYVKEWKEEIRQKYLHDDEDFNKGSDEDEKWFSDLEWVRSQIDERCVENMRMLVVDSVQEAKAGHPGLPLGMAEVGYVIYRKAMRYNPRNPNWFNRDRFVLSAGHGCLLQYICLHLSGYASVQVHLC
mgnify:FL=1